MKAYQQLELMKMGQRHNMEEEELKRQHSEDVNRIARGRIIDGSSDQLFYHMKALRICACVLACVLAYLFSKDSGFCTFLLWAGGLAAVFLVALNMARNAKLRDACTQVEDATRRRDEKLRRDLQALHDAHEREKLQLAQQIKDKMNAFARQYCNSAYITLLIDWLLNELNHEIQKADRSPFYPNVKAGISFEVSRDQIRVPGRSSYNMSAQGINIPDDPLSASALAKVLSDNVQARGSQRFERDPAGGHAVVTCVWNGNTGVEVKYSAVNANVGKTS